MISEQAQSQTLPDKQVHIQEGQEFVNLLNLIEKQINPSTCRAMGLNFWPILRFQINNIRKNGKLSSKRALPAVKSPKSRRTSDFWRKTRMLFSGTNDGMEWLDNALAAFSHEIFDEIPESDVLYLNRSTQYRRIGNTILQPITDGLRWTVDEKQSQLSLTKRDPRADGEEFLVPTGILPDIKRTRPFNLVNPKTDIDFRIRNKILTKIREVNACLIQMAPGLQLDEFTAINRLERNAFDIVYYTALLQKIRPRTVFLSSYTGAHYVCASARHLGITVVDVQHGGMYPDHPLAANWHCPPKNGYELLPDVFWCWSEENAHWVSSTIAHYHRAIAGGNPKAVVEEALQNPALAPDLPPKSADSKTRVLVALQYGKNDLIPWHVKEAYDATKGQVEWFFRLHPAGRDRLTEATQVLGIDASKILGFSDCTVRQAMAPMDVLITDASTIVYESLDLGLKTAVWSNVGANYFHQLVKEQKLGVVKSKDELIEFITKPLLSRTATNPLTNNVDTLREPIVNAFYALTT